MVFTSNIIKESDDHIYVDISFRNDLTVPQAISFNATNVASIVDRASDYYFSVIRMTCDINQLEIMRLQDNTFSVTLSYAGVDEQVFVNAALIPVNQRDATNPSFIYTYPTFITAINQAFANAFAALAISSPGFSPTAPPRLVYQGPNDGLIFKVQLEYDPAVGPNPIEVYMNDALGQLIQRFTGIFQYNATNGKDFKFAIDSNIATVETVSTTAPLSSYDPNLPQPTAGTTILNIQQPFQTFYNWYDFRTLFVSSSSLPISTQITENQNQGGANAQEGIITDFVPIQFGIGSDTLSRLEYLPTAEYRLIDLNSASPIRNIDFRVFYTSRNVLNADGSYTPIPLQLAPNQEFTIKMLFVKRAKYMMGNSKQ